MTSAADLESLPEILLTIPGCWSGPEAFARELAGKGGYLLQGTQITHVATRQSAPFGVQLHNESLARAFQLAGQNRIPKNNLAQIERHVCAITLRGFGGSVPAARSMMRVATALMRAGGLGVKVESAGIAHGREDWFKLAEAESANEPGGLYWAFVVAAGNDKESYTCGMHNLGFRDSITSVDAPPNMRASHVNDFSALVYRTNPVLGNGQQVVDPHGAVFRIWQEACSLYSPDSPCHNPYGMWRLRRADEEM